jgi:SAM-dependent methyltransferase
MADAEAPRDINGDGPIGLRDRFKYLLINTARNLRGFGTARATAHLRPIVLPDLRGQSPSRLLAEAALAEELPRLLSRPLSQNGPIEVIEIGCGTGAMATRLARLGFRGRYTGIDIADRFAPRANDAFAVTFRLIDAHDFAPSVPADLVISVSTLEHIDRDEVLLARTRAWLKPGGVEVHVVPAGAALIAYLWHGYRQYSIAALRRRFGPDARIVALGGLGTLLVHVIVITLPELVFRTSLRKSMPRFYGRALRAGIALDRLVPVGATAHLVIRHHP